MTTEQPTIWVRGELCGLGPLRQDLAEVYWAVESEPAVLAGYGSQTPGSLEERAQGLESQLKDTLADARFTVYDLTGSEPVPVGLTELSIQHRWRNAEFFIQLGAAGRGKGIGTEATRLTLDYAFHISNLENVYLTVIAENTAGIKAYEKAGFRAIGVRRNSGYWYGRRVDELFMDAVPADFPGPSRIVPEGLRPPTH